LRALQLDPDNFEAHQQYAEFLGYIGRLAEASEAARRALALDRSPIRLNVAGYIAVHDNRIEAAIRYLDEGIRADPEGRLAFLRFNRAVAHMMTDRDPAGRALMVEAFRQFDPDVAERLAPAWPPSRGLPPPEAIEVLDERQGALPAQLWMLIDRPERAIEHIVAMRDRAPFGQTDHWWSPLLDPVRDDPRVIETQEAWGLAGYEPRRTGERESPP
jgi:tetratricopeptide (TPR) repeat protein